MSAPVFYSIFWPSLCRPEAHFGRPGTHFDAQRAIASAPSEPLSVQGLKNPVFAGIFMKNEGLGGSRARF